IAQQDQRPGLTVRSTARLDAKKSDATASDFFCEVLLLRPYCRPSRLLAPALSPTLRPTLGLFLLARVELGALVSCQDVANLRRLLSTNRLPDLAGLLHVAAERNGVTLLTSSAGRVDERLRLRARSLVLGLTVLTNGLDLR